jgi:DNA-binding NarL/FixJ family response regulator
MIRVLIADDHLLFRQGVNVLLMAAKDIQIVGEARDGREAVELAQQLQPDVILMDLEMPRLDGLGATAELTRMGFPAKILFLSMRTDEKDVRAAAQRGAQGYLTKTCSRDELNAAIRTVYSGGQATSPAISLYFSGDGQSA